MTYFALSCRGTWICTWEEKFLKELSLVVSERNAKQVFSWALLLIPFSVFSGCQAVTCRRWIVLFLQVAGKRPWSMEGKDTIKLWKLQTCYLLCSCRDEPSCNCLLWQPYTCWFLTRHHYRVMPWPMYIAQADVYECTLLFSESGFSAGDAIMKREKKRLKLVWCGVVWCVLGRDMWWCAFHLIFMGACFGGAWCFFEQCCLQRLFRGGGDCLATSRWHFFPSLITFPTSSAFVLPGRLSYLAACCPRGQLFFECEIPL